MIDYAKLSFGVYRVSWWTPDGMTSRYVKAQTGSQAAAMFPAASAIRAERVMVERGCEAAFMAANAA